MYLDRLATLLDQACRIDWQKINFISYVKPLHMPNLMHTLQIHYINKFLARVLHIFYVCNVHTTCFATKWQEEQKICVPLAARAQDIHA